MKKEIRLTKECLKYALSKENLKPIIIYSIVLQFLFLSLGIKGSHLLESILFSYQDFYVVLGIFLLVSINTYHTYQAFEKNRNLLLRLGTKKKVLQQLIIQVILSNFIILILNLMIQISVFELFGVVSFKNPIYMNTSVSYLIYFIFFELRLIFILEAFSLILLFLFQLLGYLSTVFSFIIYFCTIYFSPICVDCMITEVQNMNIHPIYYLFPLTYQSLLLEVKISCIYVLFLVIIIYILYQLTYRFMKRIGE